MAAPEVYTLQFEPSGKRITAPEGQTLLASARHAGVMLKAICGGNGTCGGCMVRLVSGTLNKPTVSERQRFSAEELAAGNHLACQAVPASDAVIDVPVGSVFGRQVLGVQGTHLEVREQRAGQGTGQLGLAVDLGSTKVAFYLADMGTSEVLAQHGLINPQIVYGEDVISRIAYANQGSEYAKTQQKVTVEALNTGIAEICQQAGVLPDSIHQAVIAGNTAMHHLLLSLPVQQLGAVPYEPAIADALVMPTRDLGLHISPDASLYLPPNIAGFVGGDHVAALLTARLNGYDEPWILVDIGTNTEISLCSGDGSWSCSTASGPAFEGAHISQGMRAADGAIDAVRITPEGISVRTIGSQPAVGLCGTGILSAVAGMLHAGIIEPGGRFNRAHPLVTTEGKSSWLELVPAAESGFGQSVKVLRADVNEIQLAKAAIRSGIDILLREARLEPGQVKSWVVAGAFGSYLHLPDAISIGMFPNVPLMRFHQIGNAAGSGAISMLVSTDNRRAAVSLAGKSRYIELTTYPGFSDVYIARMALGENPLSL